MSEIVDRENGIWIAEIPVRCQTRGHLVMCNEEVIGSVEQTGAEDFLAAALDHGRYRSLRGYRTVEQAARAVAIEAMEDVVCAPLYDDLDEDAEQDAYERVVDDYILTGKGAG